VKPAMLLSRGFSKQDGNTTSGSTTVPASHSYRARMSGDPASLYDMISP
jgi:hypothetical protein